MTAPVRVQLATPVAVSNATSAAISVAALPTNGNSLILSLSARGTGTITGVTDNQGNTFTQAAASRSSVLATGTAQVWWLPGIASSGGTYTVTATSSSNMAWELGLVEFSGLSVNIDQSATLNDAGVLSTSANVVAPFSLSSNDVVITNLCLASAYASADSTFNGPHSSYSVIYTVNPNAGQLVSSAGSIIRGFAFNESANWSWSTPDGFASVLVVFKGTPLGDGFTASGTTVVTGTGGAALPVVALGNVIDVLFMAQSGTANTCTCRDNLGNTYTQIDHGDYTGAHSREFYRFYAKSLSSGTPVITCTYGASAPLSIAASVLTGIAGIPPFIGGQVANHFQTAASIGSGGTDLQSSTNTPPLLIQPVILSGWGYCDGKNGTPTVGSTFNATVFASSLWASLGAACLTYETKTYASILATSVKFTPIPNQDAYTFAATFDLISIPLTPSGPMPKQLYVMP